MEDHKIQEINRKKRSLKRYKKNLACVGRLEDKLRSLDERRLSVKSPSLSGMPRGGIKVTNEDLTADRIDLEKRIKRLKDKGNRLRDQILEEIDSLEDPRYCEVLEAFFIECKSISDIAEDMGYTDRYIYDLYKDAVTILTFGDVSEIYQ
jgi:hypothetical protein